MIFRILKPKQPFSDYNIIMNAIFCVYSVWILLSELMHMFNT